MGFLEQPPIESRIACNRNFRSSPPRIWDPGKASTLGGVGCGNPEIPMEMPSNPRQTIHPGPCSPQPPFCSRGILGGWVKRVKT